MKMTKTMITTPIYYVNDKAHIGHAYTTIIADTLARFARLKGDEVFFMSGTDEHGQKIELAAKAKGFEPKAYVDEVSAQFKALWDEFCISYDYFIRTTDERHKKIIQNIFAHMLNCGDIYEGEYEGYYCTPCETFHAQSQLIDEKLCPDCKRETILLKETNYFFRLSKYQDELLAWYEENPACVLPVAKKNELIAFVSSGLRDLCVTRRGFSWGIKPLNDESCVIYVWLDALGNYLSALGYTDGDERMSYWPASIHLVGKDILKFHAIYWPAFLMSLGLALPKTVAAHGWWTIEGEKMSKSLGNVINPSEMAAKYGQESLRFFLLSQMPFGNDGDFSQSALLGRHNTLLVNELGNLMQRVLGMSEKYFNFELSSKEVGLFDELKSKIWLHFKAAKEALELIEPHRYIEEVFAALKLLNVAIASNEPWALMKEGSKKSTDRVKALLSLCANSLAAAALLLSPLLPKSCAKIAKALGFSIDTKHFKALVEDALLMDFKAQKSQHLFEKIEMQEIKQEEKKEEKQASKKELEKNEGSKTELIKIDDFLKVDLRVARVLSCQKVEGSEKLLKFSLSLGKDESGELITKTVLSGVAAYYEPKELLGRQVLFLANLAPRVMMKVHTSEGMILTAKSGSRLELLAPFAPSDDGARLG